MFLSNGLFVLAPSSTPTVSIQPDVSGDWEWPAKSGWFESCFYLCFAIGHAFLYVRECFPVVTSNKFSLCADHYYALDNTDRTSSNYLKFTAKI